MGTKTKLKAADGHELDAYFAENSSPARGAIVLIQEIFGVNSHIRSVADVYAGQGFHVIAPALFDRVQRNVELGYNPTNAAQGMKAARQSGMGRAESWRAGILLRRQCCVAGGHSTRSGSGSVLLRWTDCCKCCGDAALPRHAALWRQRSSHRPGRNRNDPALSSRSTAVPLRRRTRLQLRPAQ